MENRESKRERTAEEAEKNSRQPKGRVRCCWVNLDPGVGPSSSWMCSTDKKKKKFLDVFISHRGGEDTDTKCILAFHMYDLLQDRGVEASLGTEEELQSGETLPEVILEAISRWKVHVCILSNGYSELVRCLQELKMMVDKYEMGTCVLIPVFYDVRASDVRHLQGPFGQRFQQQIVDRNFYDGRRWRSALRKVTKINGYEGKGEVCMAIVKKVCEELDVGSVRTIGGAGETHKQLLRTKDDIIKHWQEGLGVEISGMEGIGKTILAKCLYNLIYLQFKIFCFIEDVDALAEKYGITAVHKQLINDIYRSNPSFRKVKEEKEVQVLRESAEILIVLDNIHKKLPLSALFMVDDIYLNAMSTIIVTSWHKGVLKHDLTVAQYHKILISLEVSKLGFDTSKQIFCKYAFGEIGCAINEFNNLIKNIVDKCQHIPLALAVFGRQVYGRDFEFSKILWNDIEASSHHNLKQILKFSYDQLDTLDIVLEKCLFLHVATFLCLKKVDLLVQLWQRESDVLYAPEAFN